MERNNPFELPAVGSLLPRPRLLTGLMRAQPTVLLIEAPGGYGKSSLAHQLASSNRFENALWFDGEAQEFNERSLLQALVWQSRRQDVGERGGLASASLSALEHEFAQILASHWGKPTCLVLDNLVLNDCAPVLRTVEALLHSSIAADSCLVVTSRVRLPTAESGRSWYLEAEDLRFTVEEARAYAAACGLESSDEQDIDRLLADTSGHPALLAVMTHSLVRRGSGNCGVGREIVEQLRFLANTQLDLDELRTLTATALLRSGSIADLEAVLGNGHAREVVRRLSEKIPLLRFDNEIGSGARFSMHDIGCNVFGAPSFLDQPNNDVLLPCLECLARRQEYVVMFGVLSEWEEREDIVPWVDRYGPHLLESGAVPLLRRILERLPRAILVRMPRILLLDAQLDKLLGNPVEARRKSRLVVDLAENERLHSVAVDARMLLARLLIDAGKSREALRVLDEGLCTSSVQDTESRVMFLTHMAVTSANLGDMNTARSRLSDARDVLADGRSEHVVDGLVTACESYVWCLTGEVGLGLRLLRAVAEPARLDLDLRFSSLTNTATALCVLGRLAQASSLLEEAVLTRVAEDSTLNVTELDTTVSEIQLGRGEYPAARDTVQAVLRRTNLTTAAKVYAFTCLARASRWEGDKVGALARAEEARDVALATDTVQVRWDAELEVYACLLDLGDALSAREGASRVLGEAKRAEARCQQLCAALLIAEADRVDGNGASAELAGLADYVRSGNANWYLALYVRSFPHLLGLVAGIAGAERIPAHLLEMLKLDGAPAALKAGKRILAPDEFAVLVRRFGEDFVDPEETTKPSVCRVRLFGGLEVTTSDGPVHDADWKKRKARLLFAMLVVRKGKDVPRDQLLEYLWPEMDEERAKANFYVVWNNMKRALAPNLDKGKPCPYMRAAGGVCRIDDILVSTDLDDFEQCLLDARRAESAGDKEAMLVAFRRLAEVYRGDLLPGDIYDDWFAPLRERCRQEFGDSMLRAAQLLEAQRDYMGALQMTRAALAHEAWREDLYQAALRCQIAAGQRSAAIETYMACRHKLSEDLGLDPSADTRRLYDQVLAMEDPAEDGYDDVAGHREKT